MTEEVQDTLNTQDEMKALKDRADKIGLKYHANIGLDKLREKVNAALQPAEEETAPVDETERQKRARKRAEATKLVRVNVTCMNPNKKEWEGEIFTVSNSLVGTVKRMVPFNTDEGWHVEQIILNQLRQRQCQVFHTVKDDRGNKTRQGKLIKEFAIEELPPLTEQELKELAQRQAMAKGQ